MSLPLHWVEKIFQKLTLAYGRDFLGKWEGVPLEEVKADWAHELDGMNPTRIAFALQNLPPDRAPNVLQFRALCQGLRVYEDTRQIGYEAPRTTEEGHRIGVAAARALLEGLRRKPVQQDEQDTK